MYVAKQRYFFRQRIQLIHVSMLWPGTFVPQYCYELYDLTFKSHTAEKIYIILKNLSWTNFFFSTNKK